MPITLTKSTKKYLNNSLANLQIILYFDKSVVDNLQQTIHCEMVGGTQDP